VPPVSNPSPLEAQLEAVQVINVGDEVEVQFPHKPELDQRQNVREDGKISLPYLPPLFVAGKTPDQLREELTSAYLTLSYNPVADRQAVEYRAVQYLIAVGDVLQIHFDFSSEYSAQVRVRPDGRITLPRIKSVIAEGKTPEELESELIECYKPFVPNPSLTVVVQEPSTDRVYVDGVPTRPGLRDADQVNVVVHPAEPSRVFVTGEVNNPGAFEYHAPMTALRAIILAGGNKRSGQLRSVLILRQTGTAPSVALKIDLRPELKGTKTTDVALRPNDVVVVPKTVITRVQDVMDQYLYDLFPFTKNIQFDFFTDLTRSGTTAAAAAVAAP
jgi:polysaccharide export outer membrane protein